LEDSIEVDLTNGWVGPKATGSRAHPELLFNVYFVSWQGVKPLRRGFEHSPAPCADVKERVGLYLYNTSEPSYPVIGWNLPLPLPVL